MKGIAKEGVPAVGPPELGRRRVNTRRRKAHPTFVPDALVTPRDSCPGWVLETQGDSDPKLVEDQTYIEKRGAIQRTH